MCLTRVPFSCLIRKKFEKDVFLSCNPRTNVNTNQQPTEQNDSELIRGFSFLQNV